MPQESSAVILSWSWKSGVCPRKKRGGREREQGDDHGTSWTPPNRGARTSPTRCLFTGYAACALDFECTVLHRDSCWVKSQTSPRFPCYSTVYPPWHHYPWLSEVEVRDFGSGWAQSDRIPVVELTGALPVQFDCNLSAAFRGTSSSSGFHIALCTRGAPLHATVLGVFDFQERLRACWQCATKHSILPTDMYEADTNM